MKERPLKSQPVPVFNNRFAAALNHFGATLLETSAIKHRGTKGTKREEAFREFLAERLPARYEVVSGEVVDQLNATGPQLDVLIYDKLRDFSFSDGEVQVLAAEALLVSIEIKSRLTTGEIEKCCNAARKLRALKPFKLPLAGKDAGATSAKAARYFHCVFAFETDLAASDWLKAETKRFVAYSEPGEHLIDAVYVLKRGLLNLSYNRGRIENDNGRAITSFYFSILNFIAREGGRRQPTPYPDYASLLGGGEWGPLNEE